MHRITSYNISVDVETRELPYHYCMATPSTLQFHKLPHSQLFRVLLPEPREPQLHTWSAHPLWTSSAIKSKLCLSEFQLRLTKMSRWIAWGLGRSQKSLIPFLISKHARCDFSTFFLSLQISLQFLKYLGLKFIDSASGSNPGAGGT